MPNNTIVIRCILVLVLLAGGLAFPFLFLLAGFVAWTIWTDLIGPKAPEPDPNAWYIRRHTVGPDDPDWKSCFTPRCESPAETAFLEAMIDAFALTPERGLLKGGGITLDMQVEIRPYRADFLVNGWLVVEIDGAAYHSSAADVERDRVRDEFLTSKNYQVVRIPAKVVFTNAKEAISKVKIALALLYDDNEEKRAHREKEQRPSPSESLKGFLASVSQGLSEVNSYVTRATAVEASTKHARAQFAAEKTAIDHAVESAKRQLEVEAFCSQSEDIRRSYQEAHARLSRILEENSNAEGKSGPMIKIEPISPPTLHPDAEISEAIQSAYQRLMEERADYFTKIRDSLRNDSAMRPHVKEALVKYGCSVCWMHIC